MGKLLSALTRAFLPASTLACLLAAREGGWSVDGALAESPAEEAGFMPGDRVTEIGALFQALPPGSVRTCHTLLDFIYAYAPGETGHSCMHPSSDRHRDGLYSSRFIVKFAPAVWQCLPKACSMPDLAVMET